MIKYAPIIPPTVLRQLDLEDAAPPFTGTVFALGQELIRDEWYREYVKTLSWQGAFVIVDNGAAEKDTPPFADIASVARRISANEIALPDVLRDADATLTSTTSLSALSVVAPNLRMVVPQGNSWSEWIWCMDEIYRRLRGEFVTIGIPKLTEAWAGGRLHGLHLLWERGYHRLFNIHLLGAYKKPLHEIDIARRHGYVRSVDSGCAVAHAQNGKLLNDHEWFSLDWDKEADTWLVRENIHRMRQACIGASL